MRRFVSNKRYPTQPPPRWFWVSSFSLLLLGISFFVLSLVLPQRESRVFLGVVPIILAAAVALHAYYVFYAGRERHADVNEFASIFEHALNGILILDDDCICLNANPAALRILGIPREKLPGYTFSHFFEDGRRFASVWNLLLQGNNQRGETELLRLDGASVSVEYAIAANYIPGRHVAILCDTTERKRAERQITKHLAAVEAARSEAEVLRLSTLTLTKNLSLDTVLDTLLATLFEVIRYEAASVILTEGESLSVARTSAKTVEMLEGHPNAFFERVRLTRASIFLPDTRQEAGWEDNGDLGGVRSWICVPLLASTERSTSEQVLGLLSLGHALPNAFSQEHFRIAQSLAISAAVAIQNARLYERAEIYAAELEAVVGKQGQWEARKAKEDA